MIDGTVLGVAERSEVKCRPDCT